MIQQGEGTISLAKPTDNGSISSVDANCVDIVMLQLASNHLLTPCAKAVPVRESRRGFIREMYTATGSPKT